jgi:hypothetical protein
MAELLPIWRPQLNHRNPVIAVHSFAREARKKSQELRKALIATKEKSA